MAAPRYAERNPPEPTKVTARPLGEVYFEFSRVGATVRVAAVDAGTGTEVVVMGPATAAQADLQRLALSKLRAKLEGPRKR